jgi:hypothetical protein
MEQHSVPTQPRKEPEVIKSTSFDVKKPPEDWTADDIHEWLSSHKVPDFQSTAEMHEYAPKLRADPNKEFNKYEQRYTIHYPGEVLEEYVFNRFKNALLNLPTLPNTQPETLKTSTPKSNACIIL